MSAHRKFLEIDGENLKIDDVVTASISVPGSVVIKISHRAINKIKIARQVVNNSIEKNLIIYGLNTGFGSQAEKVISADEIELLQRYLIVSHAIGVGDVFDPEIIRAAQIIRINTME
jgi:histidine ammonia-lyase